MLSKPTRAALILVPSLASAQTALPCDALLTANLEVTSEMRLVDPVALPWEDMDPNKAHLFRRVLNGADAGARSLHFTKLRLNARANLGELPVPAGGSIDIAATYYDYRTSAADQFRVYVNFAEHDLFGYWATSLFAQDEQQVAEHPALAILRESARCTDPAAMKLGRAAREVALVTDVPRMAQISNDLYGSAFARATTAEIDHAVTTFDQPRSSNILAMAAKNVPPKLAGRPYTEADVRFHVDTALTGFAAAKRAAGQRRLILHTGHWGAGAFGNDAEMMAMVQILAARAAGVDQLVYHAVSRERADAIRRALARLDETTCARGPNDGAATLGAWVRALVAMRRPYGRGNGT